MHQTVLDFVQRTITSDHVQGKRVLEVGSYDVNGSVRPYVESLDPYEYLGVDLQRGPGVDEVADCERLGDFVGDNDWDLVISTEMLEHVRDWRRCMCELVNVVRPGGLLLITTRSPGFPYHPFPEDHWRYTQDQMAQILAVLNTVPIRLERDPEPGVFAFARKPHGAQSVSPNALLEIDVKGVVDHARKQVG